MSSGDGCPVRQLSFLPMILRQFLLPNTPRLCSRNFFSRSNRRCCPHFGQQKKTIFAVQKNWNTVPGYRVSELCQRRARVREACCVPGRGEDRGCFRTVCVLHRSRGLPSNSMQYIEPRRVGKVRI